MGTLISFDSTFISEANAVAYGINKAIGVSDAVFVDESIHDCKVIWQLEPEMRDRCIKSMGLSIVNIQARIEWNADDEDTLCKEGTINFNTDALEFSGWDIINNVKFQPDGGCYISEVEFDFHKREVAVS